MASSSPTAIPLPPIYCMTGYVYGAEAEVGTPGNDWQG